MRMGLRVGPISAAMILSVAMGVPVVPAQAEEAQDDCLYLSPDPDDRSGPPVRLSATLDDFDQVHPTSSPGSGTVELVLERPTLSLSWVVEFENLTSEPVSLKVHGPTPAEGLAPPLFDMAVDGIRSQLTGQRTLSVGEVTSLVQSLLYVNLATERYPEGELRGRIRKVRPDCSR